MGYKYERWYLKHMQTCGRETKSKLNVIFRESNAMIVKTSRTEDGIPISRITYPKNNPKRPGMKGAALYWECLICEKQWTIRSKYYNHMRRHKKNIILFPFVSQGCKKRVKMNLYHSVFNHTDSCVGPM